MIITVIPKIEFESEIIKVTIITTNKKKEKKIEKNSYSIGEQTMRDIYKIRNNILIIEWHVHSNRRANYKINFKNGGYNPIEKPIKKILKLILKIKISYIF